MADVPDPGAVPPKPAPAPINFPPPKPNPAHKNLVLRRRRGLTHSPFEVSDTSLAARESIRAVVEATRAPFMGGHPPLDRSQASELEKSLRQLEASLAERERIATEVEMKLADREREMAEMEALLVAREQLHVATRKSGPAKVGISKEEQEAVEKLRDELERQEATIKEERQALKERQEFLDEAETKLFEKVQAQQEKETELEQREEDLRARTRELREKIAKIDPAAAATLQAEDAKAKKHDEFND
jgi:chromosome segregation ATPase